MNWTAITSTSDMSEDLLESWKEIAMYLRRDIRTVQRWEQTNGLPVHRHQRGQRPIPYAYKSEIDAWWSARSGIVQRDRPVPLPLGGDARLRVRYPALVSFLILVCVAIAWLWSR